MRKQQGKEKAFILELAAAFKSPKVAYDPEKMLRAFSTIQFRDYKLNVWQKNCFMGQVLEQCTDIHNGKRKYLLSRMLKILIQTEGRT